MCILSVACIGTGNEGDSLVEDQYFAYCCNDEDEYVKSHNFAVRNILAAINVLLVHAELVDTYGYFEHVHKRNPNRLELLECNAEVDMPDDCEHKDDQEVQFCEIIKVSLELGEDLLEWTIFGMVLQKLLTFEY